ncbi:MAG TPA: hypothetical protein VLF89_00660 [Candidatus Saccharimonadales bacterium]|nr:hypothetical protein [Candidatus Saccharimonadales bacterium]
MACVPLKEISTDFGCVPTDPAGFVGKFYGVGLSIIGGVAILFIIYGGYLFLTSQGNQLNVEKAKMYITYAIIGLLFAVFGFVLIQLLAVDVLHIPGFK